MEWSPTFRQPWAMPPTSSSQWQALLKAPNRASFRTSDPTQRVPAREPLCPPKKTLHVWIKYLLALGWFEGYIPYMECLGNRGPTRLDQRVRERAGNFRSPAGLVVSCLCLRVRSSLYKAWRGARRWANPRPSSTHTL